MKTLNTLIIGAGPAGIQLGYYLEKAGRDYLILEGSNMVGHSFHRYPRHRMLISINKCYTGKTDPEYNMRHDWNSLLSEENHPLFKEFSQEYFPQADALLDYLNAYVNEHNIKIAYEARVEHIEKCKDTNNFIIRTANGETYQAQHLVVATGVQDPYIPNIPGIELVKGYEDVSIKKTDFTNKNVLIIGKGNSGLETADNLVANAAIMHIISPTQLKFAWDTRFVGHIRAVNNNFFDTYHLKSQNASIDAKILEIKKNPETGKLAVKFELMNADNEAETLEYDEVIRCTGFRFNTDMFSMDCKPNLSDCGKLPRMKTNFESTNIDNLFYAGTITQMLDYKKTQSGFIHGFRYNTRTLFHLLEERSQKTPYPSQTMLAIPHVIASKVLARFNHASSLWQQVGYLADVLVPEGNVMRWYHDLPYQYIMDNKERFGRDFYISQFRIKPCMEKSFTHKRPSNVYDGEQSTEIHPVFEHIVDGMVKQNMHVLEDLLSDWSGNEYVNTVISFFESTLEGRDYTKAKEELREKLATNQSMRHIVRDGKMKTKDAAF